MGAPSRAGASGAGRHRWRHLPTARPICGRWLRRRSVVRRFPLNLRQSAFRLRGYNPGQFAGNDFNLVNVEYRAPLWYPDRGISTLPVFLRSLSGAAFLDYGAAYDRLDLNDPLALFHAGVGAELWLDLFVGYFISANLRFGVAKGLDSKAPSGMQTYSGASSAF